MSNKSNSQELNYIPEQKASVSDDDYRFGIKILKETYEAIENDNRGINYADYWNLALAYKLLCEDKETVLKFLDESQRFDAYGFAYLFSHEDVTFENWKDYFNDEEFEKMKSKANHVLNGKKNEVEKTSSTENQREGIDSGLVQLIKSVGINDQKYRKRGNIDLERQKKYDQRNISIIDSLHNKYQVYIGTSLVGADNSHVMWSVVQHSDLTNMKKYLPVIKKGVENDEVDLVPLKMLIDRICFLENGFQVFGSQVGVPLGPEDQIGKIRKENDL